MAYTSGHLVKHSTATRTYQFPALLRKVRTSRKVRPSYIVAADVDFFLWGLQLQYTGYSLLSNLPLLADVQPGFCMAYLKLAKAPKFLLCLKFFSNCTQSKSKQQSRRNRNKLINCSVTVKCFLLTQSVTAINFKTITIAYSVSALVDSLVHLLCLFAALFYDITSVQFLGGAEYKSLWVALFLCVLYE